MNQVTAATKGTKPWAAVVASLFCSAAALYFFNLYGILHWQVLEKHYGELSESLKQPLFQLLSMLEAYRLFGLFAVIFAVWATMQKPRWLGITCTLVAVPALFVSIVVM